MAKAIWKEVVLAESDKTRVVEGNHYFPPDSIHWEYFSENRSTSVCPWKGVAKYYDVEVDGQVNRSAAWTYQEPSDAAGQIKGYLAFWNGVKVKRGENGQDGGVFARLRSLFD